MINWKTIVGIILLLVSIRQLYVLSNETAVAGVDTLWKKVGCGIWMAVGLFLVLRGMTTKKEL